MTLQSQPPSRNLPIEYYVLSEWHAAPEIIGTFNDAPIPACIIDDRGKSLHFAGIAPKARNGAYNVACLREGEWIVRPGLIYADDRTDNR